MRPLVQQSVLVPSGEGKTVDQLNSIALLRLEFGVKRASDAGSLGQNPVPKLY
jgi:hypothetical protein